ncbi:hypothetical protein T11_15518 [Trichinella zimbabwensis]|uniref:Uncharacterized protein n=1 Tax=Trichinella zimbabwensis TaxID=268475 RepID=A0A0V1HAH7_9BILA|nr:hypothetical protein T11_15518 [Trichinella zimbabwensis]
MSTSTSDKVRISASRRQWKAKGVTIASFFFKGHGANDRGRCEKAQCVGGEEENGVQAVQLK